MSKFAIFASARTGSTSIYNIFRDIGIKIEFEPFRYETQNELIDIYSPLIDIYEYRSGIKHLSDHLSTDSMIISKVAAKHASADNTYQDGCGLGIIQKEY